MEKLTNAKLPPRETIPGDLHPVVTRQYTLVTPMLEAVVAEGLNCLSKGVHSAVFEGESRIGKTKTRRYFARALTHVYPRVTILTYLATRAALRSERAIYGSLLKSIRHPFWDDGTVAKRRDRLLERLFDLAQSSGQSKCVLLIDEAEYLLEADFHLLAGLYNELDERGIELFTFQFGRPQIAQVRDDLRRSGQNQLLARFFEDRVCMWGIRKASELKACLGRYDTHTQFPDGTDWTFPRYYFPDAVAKGWRLASLAPNLWAAFEEVHRQSGQSGPLQVPMKHFARTVEQVLLHGLVSQDVASMSHAELVAMVVASRFGNVLHDDADDEREVEEKEL